MSTTQLFYNVQYALRDLGLQVGSGEENNKQSVLLDIAGSPEVFVSSPDSKALPKDAIKDVLDRHLHIGMAYEQITPSLLRVTFNPYRCPNCNGDGSVFYDEEGQRGNDACYHCGTTGRISTYQHVSNRFARMVRKLAESEMAQMYEAGRNDPDFDGWGLMAAENQMSEYEYLSQRVYEESQRISKELLQLSATTIRTLMDLIAPDEEGMYIGKKRTPVTKSADPMVLQMPSDPIDDDDIPF